MKTLLTLSTLLMIVAIPAWLFAQGPPPLPDFGNDEVPLNGLAILAAAGGAYAVKKLRDRKE